MKLAEVAPDRISDLPDGVLSNILSLLTLKEAAATSVLSRRWECLWIFRPRLIFDDEKEFSYSKLASFTKRVDYVVSRYPKGMALQEFCLRPPRCFFVEWRRMVDWLDFAFSAGATKVELDVCTNSYSVPIELFRTSKRKVADSTRLNLVAESAPLPPRYSTRRFISLRELFLFGAHVCDEVFEAILSTCASLECLVLAFGGLLHSAKCTVPHLKLKHLTIDRSWFEDLEIIAPNLVSFNYKGSRANLTIHGARSLANAAFLSYPSDEQKGFLHSPISGYTSQLKSLTLVTNCILERIAQNNAPSMCNLRTVSLVDMFWSDNFRCSLPSCHRAALCLLEASPLLQRFEFHLCRPKYANYEEGTTVLDELEKISMSPHRNLKEIMLTGFRHHSEHRMQFVMFIAGRAAALESVEVTRSVVEYHVDRRGFFNWRMRKCQFISTQKDVEELRSMLPPNIHVKTLHGRCTVNCQDAQEKDTAQMDADLVYP